jgi:hypothetical protein
MTTDTAVLAEALPGLLDVPPEVRVRLGAELLYAEHLAARPGVDHWYCCDRTRALCGADLRGGTEAPDATPNCVVCEGLLGAACSPACDYAKWGES